MYKIDIEDLLTQDVFDTVKQLNQIENQTILEKEIRKNRTIKNISKMKLKKIYDYMISKEMLGYNEYVDNYLINIHNRMKSGVMVVTVYTKPEKCSGKCLFCPTEPDMPKSYLTSEPLGKNAKLLNFDPILQINKRLDIMGYNGNVIDKLEILIVGGSWLQYQYDYQCQFMCDIIYAVNTYGDKLPRKKLSLIEEQNFNKTHSIHISGITIETRPDDINETTIRNLRFQGCTRVQIGVQHINNHVLELNKRGHTIETSINSTRLLKESGFKVDHHYMLNLYGSTREEDVNMFNDIFGRSDLQPDQIKIYPCFVNEYAELFKLYKSGEYNSYDDETLIDSIIEIKKKIPPYVRINRILRDFPRESIVSGTNLTGIRDVIKHKMNERHIRCNCIRCREIGIRQIDINDINLEIINYEASNGIEYFISFVNTDKSILYGFLRLRINNSHDIVFDELKGSTIIRELHVYGKLRSIGKGNSDFSAQHIGLGTKLIEIAVEITKKYDLKKISVISGIGVKGYYEKKGFVDDGLYMSKYI